MISTSCSCHRVSDHQYDFSVVLTEDCGLCKQSETRNRPSLAAHTRQHEDKHLLLDSSVQSCQRANLFEKKHTRCLILLLKQHSYCSYISDLTSPEKESAKWKNKNSGHLVLGNDKVTVSSFKSYWQLIENIVNASLDFPCAFHYVFLYCMVLLLLHSLVLFWLC